MEERIAKLETNLEHLQSDVSGITADVRRLNDKFDGLQQQMNVFAITLEKGFAKLDTARAQDRIWWLLTCAAMLGVMARALKWF